MPRRTSNFADGGVQNGAKPSREPEAQISQPPPKTEKEKTPPTGHRYYAAFARSGQGTPNPKKCRAEAQRKVRRVGNNNQHLLRRLRIGGV